MIFQAPHCQKKIAKRTETLFCFIDNTNLATKGVQDQNKIPTRTFQQSLNSLLTEGSFKPYSATKPLLQKPTFYLHHGANS